MKTHDLKYCEMQNKKNAGPGPPDDDSPTEPPDPAHTTAIITLSKTELNHSANNLTNHHTKDHNNHDYSPRQGSLTNSTGSERESDSAYVCDSESPNDNLPPDNDVFDWWFHRNTRGSHKSRYTIIFDAHLFPPDEWSINQNFQTESFDTIYYNLFFYSRFNIEKCMFCSCFMLNTSFCVFQLISNYSALAFSATRGCWEICQLSFLKILISICFLEQLHNCFASIPDLGRSQNSLSIIVPYIFNHQPDGIKKQKSRITLLDGCLVPILSDKWLIYSKIDGQGYCNAHCTFCLADIRRKTSIGYNRKFNCIISIRTFVHASSLLFQFSLYAPPFRSSNE